MSHSRIAVAGASGYSGQELVGLLKAHPQFKIEKLIDRETQIKSLEGNIDLAFLCTPNEVSLELAPKLLDSGISVIDVSGAFRLKKHSYTAWYGFEHNQNQLLKNSFYGLYPWKQFSRSGSSPSLIANPGCFATAVLMGILPMIKENIINTNSLVIDAKSGTTGAGRKASVNLLFSEVHENFHPYRVGQHQHWPEIVEVVEDITGANINPAFVTELLPVKRGISAAIFAEPKNLNTCVQDTLVAFQKYYREYPDIQAGTDETLATLKNVQNSNKIHIYVTQCYSKLAVFVSIDNLLRGAAGQALMNANLWAGQSAQEGIIGT